MEFIEVSSFKFDPKHYQFCFKRIDEEAQNKFWDAVEYLDTTNHFVAITWLEQLVAKLPEFIDTWMHLGLAYKTIEEHTKCLSCLTTAVFLGKNSLPAKFNQKKHQLIWAQYENRPFLRACHALGMEYQVLGWHRDALELYQFILDVNPDDNQGVRELVTECYLGLGEYDNFIEFYDKGKAYSTTGMNISYALVLLATGKVTEAKDYISAMWYHYHLIWKELLKKRHAKPKVAPEMIGYTSECGSDMAYEYWQRCGKYWDRVEGALVLLKEISLKPPMKTDKE